tara:strand:- start:12544 stop:14724 length:2181 start_codon:yes stop_codon:yes gene_type:complete
VNNIEAQEYFKGEIFQLNNNGDKIPVSEANVAWEGYNISAISKKNGQFTISIPETLPSTIIVSFVGYKTYKKLIDENVFTEIILDASVEISEIEIEGNINSTIISSLSPINEQTLTSCELEKAACCNLSESFTTNTTVEVSFTDAVSGAKHIKMLGLDGVYTQITNKNMPLIRGVLSSYGISYMPGTWIESIKLIKGTGSVVNGHESITGQIDVNYYEPIKSPKIFWNTFLSSDGKLENNLILSKKISSWNTNLFTHCTYFNREIDNHGGENHNSDGFLDSPKNRNLNIMNQWENSSNEKHYFLISGQAIFDNRDGGTISNSSNPYFVNIDNKIFQISSRLGFLLPRIKGSSYGIQTSFTKSKQNADFGDNIYEIEQESIYLNFIKRNRVFDDSLSVLKYGFSTSIDKYNESLLAGTHNIFDNKERLDVVNGLFFEYNHNFRDFVLLFGLRGDHYNKTKSFYFSPRINIKYTADDKFVFRITSGRGFRVSNVISENISLLASNRNIIYSDNLCPEIAWNHGLNFVYNFKFNGNEGIFNFDIYRINFQNQVVIDLDQKSEVSFYNLTGNSSSNCLQSELFLEIFDDFDMKLGYKINKVKSTFSGMERFVPLTPFSRGMCNFSYETINSWEFNLTFNRIGKVRIPSYFSENGTPIDSRFSSPFLLINSQVTKKFDLLDFYVGSENISNYTQDNYIISSSDPSSDFFDASLIYAPIHGRMFYLGFRYKF